MLFSTEVFKLQELLSGLSYLGSLSLKPRSAIANMRNVRKLTDEISVIQALQKAMYSDEDILSYETQRISLCEKYCVRDEAGLPILKGGQYLFETKEAVDGASNSLVALEIDFPAGANKKKEADKSNEELLNSTIELELHDTFISDISEHQAFTPAKLQAIFHLLKE